MKKYNIETIAVQGGYKPGNSQPRQLPIYQSTTFKYDTSADMAKLFDLESNDYMYSRLANPTCDAVAAKIAALEGGASAMLTSSGQAANFSSVFNIAGCGDHIGSDPALEDWKESWFNRCTANAHLCDSAPVSSLLRRHKL